MQKRLLDVVGHCSLDARLSWTAIAATAKVANETMMRCITHVRCLRQSIRRTSSEIRRNARRRASPISAAGGMLVASAGKRYFENVQGASQKSGLYFKIPGASPRQLYASVGANGPAGVQQRV